MKYCQLVQFIEAFKEADFKNINNGLKLLCSSLKAGQLDQDYYISTMNA